MQKIVNFIEKENCLRIELCVTPEEAREDIGEDGDFYELIEWQLANGYETIQPFEIGALTDGFLLSPDTERNDDYEIVKLGKIYWDSNYQIQNCLEEVLNKGYCDFTKA